jgi:hypothetical protein
MAKGVLIFLICLITFVLLYLFFLGVFLLYWVIRGRYYPTFEGLFEERPLTPALREKVAPFHEKLQQNGFSLIGHLRGRHGFAPSGHTDLDLFVSEDRVVLGVMAVHPRSIRFYLVSVYEDQPPVLTIQGARSLAQEPSLLRVILHGVRSPIIFSRFTGVPSRTPPHFGLSPLPLLVTFLQRKPPQSASYCSGRPIPRRLLGASIAVR